MKTHLIIYFLFFFTYSFGQVSQPLFSDTLCGEKFCIDCGEDNKADFKKGTLSEYFKSKLAKYDLAQIVGIIQIQIIVDEKGAVCCKHFVNNTNASNQKISKLSLQNIVNSMPKWTPAKTKGKSQTSSVLVNLEIQQLGKIKAEIQRINTKEWIIEKID